MRLVSVSHSSTRNLIFNSVPGDGPQETTSILPCLLSLHTGHNPPALSQIRRIDCLCGKGCGFSLRLLEPLIHTKISAKSCFGARGSGSMISPPVQAVSSNIPEGILTYLLYYGWIKTCYKIHSYPLGNDLWKIGVTV